MTSVAQELAMDRVLESAGVNVHIDHLPIGFLNRQITNAVAWKAFVCLLSQTQACQEENTGAKLDY
jgi:hypothetical protein